MSCHQLLTHTHQHEKCTFFFTCQSQVNHLPLQICFLHGGNHYAKQNTYLNCHYAHMNSTKSPLFIFQTIEYNIYTVTCHTTVPWSNENDTLFVYVGFITFCEILRTRKCKITSEYRIEVATNLSETNSRIMMIWIISNNQAGLTQNQLKNLKQFSL